MNICGIIAEYNPFHNGHLYHLKNALEITQADYSVVVMSGNFMQRGYPALADKFARAEAALRCGADLVLELPVCYSTGSAEYFAAGAVLLLHSLGAVSHICFGSECGDVSLLQKIARVLLNESESFQEVLRFKLKSGRSFPTARSEALLELYPELSPYMTSLTTPNNILGIEYVKTLLGINSPMLPVTIMRTGADYHNEDLTDTISSATALRHALENGVPLNNLSSKLPDESYHVLGKYFSDSQPVYLDDFSSLLHYKLLSEQNNGYDSYWDVSAELSDRIKNNLYRFTTYTEFINLLKTRELTHSRISRSLLHILLNIQKQDIKKDTKELHYVPYARILGFRRSAVSLLSEIKKQSQIPFLSKLADAHKILDESALNMLKTDIISSDIYNSVRAAKSSTLIKNEYSTPIVIIE